MKQFMFIALALLLAACEKPVLDNEDAVTKKDANVILHFKQYEQAAFDTDPTPTPPLQGRGMPTDQYGAAAPLPSRGGAGVGSVTRSATDITELCSRLNIAIFDADGTKVKTVAQKESDAGYGTVALTLAAGTYQLVVIAHNCEGSATITSTEKVTFPNIVHSCQPLSTLSTRWQNKSPQNSPWIKNFRNLAT